MPDPRVQTGDEPERLTGISPEVPDGFVLTLLTGLGRWAKLSHVCGGEHTFVGPSADRVRWYVTRHRCGPGRWDEGEEPVEPAAIEEGEAGIAGRTPVERLVVVVDEIASMIGDVPAGADVDELRAAVERCAQAVSRRFPRPGELAEPTSADVLVHAVGYVAHLLPDVDAADMAAVVEERFDLMMDVVVHLGELAIHSRRLAREQREVGR